MTELEILRKQKKGYEDTIEERDQEITALEDKVFELENPEEENDSSALDTSTLDKSMMFEKLHDNWDYIKQSDIDAICRL